MGACTPRPKKLKKASAKIAVGIVSVIVVMIGPIALGIKWRIKMRGVEAPSALAAKIYSAFLSRRICPRTMRAIGTHPVNVSARMRVPSPDPIITVSKITTRR